MRRSCSLPSEFPGLFTLLILLCALGACRPAGPDYHKPVIVTPPAWNARLDEGLKSGNPSDESLGSWWTSLHDPILQHLVERAIQGNLDLRQATAVIREARARRGIVAADRFPTVTADGRVGYQRTSDRMGHSVDVGLFGVGFDAAWEMDVFGRTKRAIESADASLEATEESLRETLVSLVAEVALNYVELRQNQRQLQIAEENLRLQEDTLRLARERFEAGLTTRLDVDQAQYTVSQTRSRIPPLRVGIEQAKNRLSVLLGEPPGGLSGQLDTTAPIPVGPPEIVVGVPAEALRRRPDVRRAERMLAAQTAAVGVATASKYPQFALYGSIGYEAITQGNPLSLGNLIGSLGASAFQVLFDAGRIRQTIEVQNALQEQALLDYESVILLALEESENAMTAYADEQVRRRDLIAASESAQRAVTLVRENYAAGLVDFLGVLESQRALLTFQDQIAQSDGAITSHLIRLYKALGGGWKPMSASPAAANPTQNP